MTKKIKKNNDNNFVHPTSQPYGQVIPPQVEINKDDQHLFPTKSFQRI